MTKQRVTFRRIETIVMDLDVIQPLRQDTLRSWAASALATNDSLGVSDRHPISREVSPWEPIKGGEPAQAQPASRKRR